MNLRTWMLAAFVALLFGATATYAQNLPPAPSYISGIAFDNNVDGSTIRIAWNMPRGVYTVTQYNVYGRLQGNSFALIDTVGGSNNADSMAGNYYWQHITVDGTYDIYVTAVNNDGEGIGSDTISVEVVTPPFRFRHIPSNYDSLFVGDTYNDSVVVMATGNDEVRYHVYPWGHNDNSATIDSITGAFSWTPSAPGYYQFLVRVTLANTPGVQDSAFLVFNVIDPNRVYFNSNVLTAQVDTGQTVQNYFHAAGGSGTITYNLISMGGDSANIDFTIDVNSGYATFTPHAYGTYQFQVGAYLNGASTPSATQNGYVQAVDPSTLPISVMGVVIDSNQTYISSLVRVYRQTSDTSNNTTTYEMYDSTWGSSSYFSFRGLPAGSYILHATPDDTNHTAAYYRANFDVALQWEDATVIGDNTFDSTVIVVPIIEGQGSNRLHGRATRSGGRAGLREDGRSLGSADEPLAGATVFAVDNNGHVQGADVTDVDGYYDINSLGAGTFTVTVDAVGYTSTPQEVSFAGVSGGSHETNLHSESTSGTSGVILNPMRVEVTSAWPTPARERATIAFNGVAGNAELNVVDANGRVVRNEVIRTSTGDNLVVLKTADLAAGSYVVRIAMGTRMVTAPLVIVR